MKYLLLAVVAFSTLVGVSTKAEAYDRVGYRYSVRYSDFDRGFYRTYGYREECYTSYSYYSTRTTCYDVNPNDYVYVEERTFYDSYGRRYTRVYVYRDQYASRPVVYYNTYEYGSTRTVVYREWYSSSSYYYTDYRYYRSDYYYTYYTPVVIQLDWDQWETKYFVGAYTQLLGVDILLNTDSDLGTIVGVGAILVGKVKKAQALEQRASELQKNIESSKKDSSGDNFDGLD